MSGVGWKPTAAVGRRHWWPGLILKCWQVIGFRIRNRQFGDGDLRCEGKGSRMTEVFGQGAW